MFNENDEDLQKFHLRNNTSDCQKKINRLEKDLRESEKNAEQINELYSKLLKDSTVKAKKIRDLQGEVEDLEEQLKKCQGRQKELEDQLQECKASRKELEDQLQECKARRKELEDQLKECQDKRQELEDKLAKCKEEKKELEDKLAKCKEEKQELEDELKETKEKCKEEKKELEDKLKDIKEKCDDESDDDLVITDDKEVAKFIMEVLDKAIPHSARIKNCPHGKYIINKDEEISDLTPSTLLLQRKEKDGLVLKIWQEILMTNFWNGDSANYGLYSAWTMNTLDYSYKGNWGANYRLFPKTKIKNHDNDSIIWSGMLFHSAKQLYFDKIFEIIEQYLQKHDVNCTVEKKFNPSHGRIWGTQKVIVSHGSLPFPKVKIKEKNSNSPYYYLQVNFDIKMKSSNKAYPIRGYTMLLTDALDLYKIGNSNDEKSNNDYENINDEFSK